MRAIWAVLAVGLVASAALGGSWPDGKKAAVVLTYDDSLTSQLDHALPALDAAGLKATFFLSGADIEPGDVARWRAAAAEGHELGNHSIFHPCARATYPAPDRYTAEAYTVDTMLTEIAAMNTLLIAIDGKSTHVFATPCGNRLAGGVDYVVPLHQAGLARYVRGVDKPGIGIDPLDVPCLWFDEKATGADMIAAVKRAEQAGDLAVLGFHGIGGDYLSVSTEAHSELIGYLKAHSDTIWVAPFSTVMDYVTAQKPN